MVEVAAFLMEVSFITLVIMMAITMVTVIIVGMLPLRITLMVSMDVSWTIFVMLSTCTMVVGVSLPVSIVMVMVVIIVMFFNMVLFRMLPFVSGWPKVVVAMSMNVIDNRRVILLFSLKKAL